MAIKGIQGQPFINLTNFIDLTEFDKMQSEFFKGFALAKNLAQIGNLDIDHNWLDINDNYKPLIIAYEEFKTLPKYSSTFFFLSPFLSNLLRKPLSNNPKSII